MTEKAQPAAPKRSSKEQFDRQAAQYNTQWNSWSEQTLAWMIDNAHCAPGDRVLDVATGSGFTAVAFAPLAERVDAVDVSTGMLAEAQKRANEKGLDNVSFIEAPAEKLPFADRSFDIVVCRIAAHHFLSVADFVAEAARVLRPGGRFLLVDTAVPDDDQVAGAWQNEVEALRDTSHVKNLTPSQWASIVAAAGLVVEQASDAGDGIMIPLEDWIAKAGCAPEQASQVRQRFKDAPASARAAFRIVETPDQGTVFTWRRVLLKAAAR